MKKETSKTDKKEAINYEPLLCPVLYTYVTTHEESNNGGRKIHITELGTGIAICGYSNLWTPTTKIDKNWLKQPDPDEVVCKKCRKIANSLLNGA